MTAGAPLLTVERATIGRCGRALQANLSFSVARGGLLAVLGRNGVGKSTLLATLQGDLAPLSGRVLLHGRPPGEFTARERARLVAVLPEAELLPYDFQVETVVELGRLPHRGLTGRFTDADHRAIERAVAATDIAALLTRGINELSAGERQRVLLARALAQEPELLFLDEPTAHLDPGRQAEVMTALRRLSVERALAVVAVLHDPNLASRFADQILLLGTNGPIACGAPTTVITEPALAAAYGTPFRILSDPAGGARIAVVAMIDPG